MKHPILAGAAVTIGLSAILAVPGVPGDPVASTAEAASEFYEPFETAASLDRFDFALHNPVPFNEPIRTWPGDHDASCGPPTTSRTIHMPGNRTPGDGKIYVAGRASVGDTLYWCAPGGDPAKAHMMTSFLTIDYAQIQFSPKGYYNNVRRVCWDQNMTDLGIRKWTQLVVVPQNIFEANGKRMDYVTPRLDAGPASFGTKLPNNVFLMEVLGGSTNVHWNGGDYNDFHGFLTADKARRFTTCVTDQNNGTVKIELERESSVETRFLTGAFPDGPVKVIFQDDTYNALKSPPSLNVPNPFTWHWDNILVSGSPGPAVTVKGSTPPPPVPEVPSNGQYDALVPARLLDTRAVQSTVDWKYAGAGLRPAGSVTTVAVRGRGGVPSNSGAVSVNLAVVGALGAGFATVYPCGNRPNASTINFAAGDTIANGIVAKLDGSGRLCIYTNRPTHLLLDVNGSFPTSSPYSAVSPARLLETRSDRSLKTVDGKSANMGTRPAGSVTTVQVAGRGGVPGNATAAVLNVAVVGAGGAGFATVYPCGSRPNASTINFAAGDTIANGIVAKLDGSGRVCIYTNRAANLLLDVGGSLPSSFPFIGLTPARLLETRNLSTVDGKSRNLGLRPAGSVTVVQVAGRGGVPANARSAVLNTTVVGATGDGYATLYPCGNRPNTSTVNYGPGDTIANSVISMLDSQGRVCIYTHRAAHLLLDVSGALTTPVAAQATGLRYAASTATSQFCDLTGVTGDAKKGPVATHPVT
jgi:hypothetical protein